MGGFEGGGGAIGGIGGEGGLGGGGGKGGGEGGDGGGGRGGEGLSLRTCSAFCATKRLTMPLSIPTTQMLAKFPRQERPRGVGGRRDASALSIRSELTRLEVPRSLFPGAWNGTCSSRIESGFRQD